MTDGLGTKTCSLPIANHFDEVFLTEQHLASRHQRSVKTLRNARVTGGYVPFVRIGRSVRYRLSDVVAYEQTNLTRSTSDWDDERRDESAGRYRGLAKVRNASNRAVLQHSDPGAGVLADVERLVLREGDRCGVLH